MSLFSTDGIRGKYPSEVNKELFKTVGRSLSSLGQKVVVIGYDKRKLLKSYSIIIVWN